MTTDRSDRAPDEPRRWRSHRFASATLQAAIALAPIGLGFLAGAAVADALPEPTDGYEVALWWVTVVIVSSVVATIADRIARRFLPLTALLRMTMLFPDRAPSRMRVALRSGNRSELRRRIASIQDGDRSRAESAELILSLAAAISEHDRKTRGHSERTRAYTEIIAEEMGIPDDDRDRLRWAALLHDVGKLEVPAEILNKDGKLTPDEWEIVKHHPVAGMRLVAPIAEWLGPWAKTIEHHHERWDGTGYPKGLAGTEIALGARIVAVADAYDVMTSGRSYQRAKTPDAARREIVAHAGRQFDPTVARALMNASLGKLRWATGPLAVLAEIPVLRGLPQVGRDLAVLLTSTAVMTTTLVTGAVPAPASVQPSRILEVVIAGAGFEAPDLQAMGAPASGPDGGVGVGDPAGTGPGTDAPTSRPPGGADAPTGAGNTVATTTPPVTPPPSSTTAPATTATTITTTTTTVSAAGPVAVSDVATTDEDTPVTIAVLANDTDPDGDLDPASLTIAGAPGMGTATVTAGSIRYRPDLDVSGEDRLSYLVCDLGGRCATATVTVTIRPVDDPPVARPDSAVADGGPVTIDVLANDTDPDGDPLALDAVGTAGSGTTTIAGNTVVYTPDPGFEGTDTFAYGVCDPSGACASATVTVSVTAPPPGALAVGDDTASTRPDAGVIVKATANDLGDLDQSTLEVVSGPEHGTASNVGGSGNLRYEPDPGFTGVDVFTYRICDVAGVCDTATVTVTVG